MTEIAAKSHFFNTRAEAKYIDSYGHMNNAAYLTLMEDARWDLLTAHGYSAADIQRSRLGPVVLAVELQYLKEIKLDQGLVIETRMLSYEGKIGKLYQEMRAPSGDVHAKATFTLALFDLDKRKLVLPTPEWLKAIGLG